MHHAEATVQLLKRFSDAWTAADIDALMACVTDDCVYGASAGPEPGRTYRGRDEVRRGFLAMLRYDQGRKRRDSVTVAQDGIAVTEWEVDETRGCDIFEIADGRIRRKDAFRKVLDSEP